MMSGLGTGGYVAMGWNMGGGMANADMVVGKSWMSITPVNNNFVYLFVDQVGWIRVTMLLFLIVGHLTRTCL